MTSATWLSAAATVFMALGVLVGMIWRSGKRDGKIDAVLERLTALTDDHEYRLRQLERRPGGRAYYMTSSGPAPEWPQPQPRRPPDHRRRNRPST